MARGAWQCKEAAVWSVRRAELGSSPGEAPLLVTTSAAAPRPLPGDGTARGRAVGTGQGGGGGGVRAARPAFLQADTQAERVEWGRSGAAAQVGSGQ